MPGIATRFVQNRDLHHLSCLRQEHCDCESGLSALDFFDRVTDNYGVEDGVTPYDDEEGVEVPPCRLNLSEDQLEELKETIDPLSDSDNFEIDLYEGALTFLQSTIISD